MVSITEIRSVFWIVAVSVLVLGSTANGQESNPEKWSDLIFRYEVAREELRKPIREFQAKYAIALGRLEAESQGAGKLERVLAARAEREGFANGKFAAEGAFPELLAMREIYQKELEKQLLPVIAAEDGLRSTLIEDLNGLKVELTKGDQLDEAVKIANLISRIQNERSLAEEARRGIAHFRLTDPARDVNVTYCKVETRDGVFAIEPADGRNVGRLKTREAFAPPFVAIWDVATDGGNIRFYYAGFLAFLNHESGRSDLEVCDPALGRAGERRLPDKGRVSANEFHEIKLIMDRDRYAFVVDGEVRAEGAGDYTGLMDAVAFGPAYGSRLQLRRFEIHR